MKSKRYSLLGISTCLITAIFLLFFVPACFDPIAWSPNGRYMAFTHPEGSILRLWDSKYDTIRTFEHLKDIVSCRFLPHGREMLLLMEDGLMRASMDTGKIRTVETELAGGGIGTFDISRNGKYLYCAKEEQGLSQLLRKRLWHPSQTKMLYESDKEIGFPAINHDEAKLLFSTSDESNQLCLLDVQNGSVEVIHEDSERSFCWNQWIGRDQLLYVLFEEDDDEGTLCVYDLSNNQETPLCDSVSLLRPSYDAFHNRVTLSRLKDSSRELYEIVVVNLCNHQVSCPVQNAETAFMSVFSPCGCKIAYIEGRLKEADDGEDENAEYNLLKTINLENSEITTIYNFQEEL